MSKRMKVLNLSVPHDTPHLDVLTLAHRSIKNLLRVESFKVVGVDISGETVIHGHPAEGLTYRIQYVRVGKSGPIN